ncbi:hypothetical protein BH23CHL2_BH23CHL2_07760 [soil metagenome]
MRSLREWRKLRLLSIRDVAEAADLSTKTIFDAEHGNTRPTLQTMRRLCAALNVEPGQVEEFAEILGLPSKAIAA